ncbi:MAG TPA: fibronectin type III domain-containing protein [Streptosporangiaceae bacterium]|nr:fibronectin type III domain-containing protein [Streptosporangiaceae bacterium]
MPRTSLRAPLAVVLCGVLTGAVACVFVSPRPGDADPPTAPPVVPGQPYAAALTAEWVSYGRSATCADWAGGDGIQGVRVGRSTIAWFFSDTYLGTVRESTPAFRGSMINNSLVIQRESKRTTVTGGGACPWDRLPAAKPRPLLSSGRHKQWYWGGDGMVVGRHVVKFFHRFGWTTTRYEPLATAVTTVPVRRLTARDPAKALRLRPRELPAVTPVPGGTPIMWGAALLPAGDDVYVYGWQANDLRVQQKRLYLAKVAQRRLTDLTAWTFYAGAGRWTTAQAGAQPVQPYGADIEVSSAFSVAQLGGRTWLVQNDPAFGSPSIVAYPATAPWGPYDPRQRKVLYRAPGVGDDAAHDYKIVYDARVMTPLSTRDTVVIGYNVNTVAVDAGCRSLNFYTDAFYRPRFITVPTAEFTRRGGQARGVGAGTETPAPSIVRRQPSQWFHTWNYPEGCPPVPAVSGVTATSNSPGTLTLSWRDAGSDVAYRVYRRPAGSRGDFILVRTVTTPGVTLDGLTSGKRYEWRIRPINWKNHSGPVVTGVARVR